MDYNVLIHFHASGRSDRLRSRSDRLRSKSDIDNHDLDQIDHDLDPSRSTTYRYDMLSRICIAQIRPRKSVLDHADYMAPTPAT